MKGEAVVSAVDGVVVSPAAFSTTGINPLEYARAVLADGSRYLVPQLRFMVWHFRYDVKGNLPLQSTLALPLRIDGDQPRLRPRFGAGLRQCIRFSGRRMRVSMWTVDGDIDGDRATLPHYVAANGAEGYRQRPPANAVEIAALLGGLGAA
jgi:hypothetical protein